MVKPSTNDSYKIGKTIKKVIIKDPIFGSLKKKRIIKKTTQGVGTSFNKYTRGAKKSFTGLNKPAIKPSIKAKINDIISEIIVLRRDCPIAVQVVTSSKIFFKAINIPSR